MNHSISRFFRQNTSVVFVALVLFALISVQGMVLYTRGHEAMESQLRSQLRTSAALGAQYFTGEELDLITADTPIVDAYYVDVVHRLNRIRSTVPNIEYAYIMRKTMHPMTLEFVADADSLDSFEKTDLNGNGVIEPDEENSYPGDTYDVSDIPAMQKDAFVQPTTDAEISIDQWGQLISGYAPIYRSDGSVAGIIGIDMDAAEFTALSKRAFSPLLLLLSMVFAIGVAWFVGYFLWKRKVQMLTMLDKERSSLLALTSHQLGAPVVSIKWWLEILRENEACKNNKACDTIENAVNRIANIIQALREAERTEHGTSTRSARVRISDIVTQAAEQMQDIAKTKHQKIQVDCTCSCQVFIDPKLLSAVLTEILQNACIYSPEDTDIHILCKRRGGKVFIHVRDRGCGVPKGEEYRIFEKMTRGSNAGVWNTDGNGLGLYICKTVIERADGKIYVQRNTGGGSDFVITLPIAA